VTRAEEFEQLRPLLFSVGSARWNGAVFVLREVFGFGFPEVACAVGRSDADAWAALREANQARRPTD
jgi:hypothetical protein